MRAELLVVGAGPAGVSAALWARALELDVLLLDGAPAPGGQLHAVNFHPQDVPGFEQGDGPALAAAYARQLAAASVPLRTDCLAIGIRSAGGHTAVELAGGEWIEAAAVLVASGVRRRRLDVPGEREFDGRGVSYSANRDRDSPAGRRVAVVGGGDPGFENALPLSRPGRAVTPYFQATLGLSYAVMTFGESIEPGPLVDDDPGTISPHMRTALGLEFGVSGSSATRFSLFVGLDASYYSYEREIDLGYDRDESFDLDLFGEMNESELDSWADGRLSPSLGFQVAFAP